MSKKFDIKVDRTGKGRTFTIVEKGTGKVVGSTGPGSIDPNHPTAATIRRREPPKTYTPPKPVVTSSSEVDDDEGMDDATDSEVNAARVSPGKSTLEDRMRRSIDATLSRKHRP